MIHKLRYVLKEAQAFSDLPVLLRYAWNNPRKTWTFLRRSGSGSWIKNYFEDYDQYQSLVKEIANSKLVMEIDKRLAEKFSIISGTTPRGNPYVPGTMKRQQLFNAYALIRRVKPEILVETGVCNGFSTAGILAALQQNGKGHLYSIDYPEFTGGMRNDFWAGKAGAVVPSDEESGWLVPQKLRERWTLLLGKSQDRLPPLLKEQDRINLFLHDSEHSFENQLFEFRLAFSHLHPNGILLASDITWSNAFAVFWNEISDRAERYFIDHSLSIIEKKRKR